MSISSIKPDDLIALFLERNEYMIIAILAVLKTGAAYLPLDLGYPRERIDYILEDTATKIVLTNENHYDKISHLSLLKDEDLAIVYPIAIAIDSIHLQTTLSKFSKENIINAASSINLAYVIYTSGTTGHPKGVMIEHKSLVNTLYSLGDIYRHSSDEDELPLKITAFSNYVFDVSVSEFFVPLLQGDELHLLGNNSRQDILFISQYINSNHINYLYIPPVLLSILPRIKYPSLKGIIYAGEPCDRETALYWSRKTRLYNYYGPTETTIYATGLQIIGDEAHLIGKPIANTTAYVLDIHEQLQPVGIVGELYIGGAGVGRGYFNRQELTIEKYIVNPFQTKEERIRGINFRLYKTGDLVRWLPDGNLEYIGRNDFQVKLRGYRIELGEIETLLARYPGIKQSVILIKNHTNDEGSFKTHQCLIGYYTASKKIDASMLKEYLESHLPDYMQPNALIYLPELPLTANGKLDRAALPMPDLTSNNGYSPPTNDKELLICDAFSEILTLDRVGLNDDFFRIGGNSILTISLVAKLQENLNLNVSDIYRLKTPKKIALDVSFCKKNLACNLEEIGSIYHSIKKKTMGGQFEGKLDAYFNKTSQLKLDITQHQINNILLTGATGFLGCNLLNSLLNLTDYSIFLIIRASSIEDAFDRVNRKFLFYFNNRLNHFYNTRVFIYNGDIEKEDLGLGADQYQILATQIDSIIHAAALTKHYGYDDVFYSANVQATINLLNLSQLTQYKHFHYISTSSVLNQGYIPNTDYYLFTEDDDADILMEQTNVYVKTKHEGEKAVISYRKQGVNGNIYRVGNLAFMLRNHLMQENKEDNGFFSQLDSILNIGFIAPEVGLQEVSPADFTADAIIKLFDKKLTKNTTFHVFNPVKVDLCNALIHFEKYKVKEVNIDRFMEILINKLNQPKYRKITERFLLHRGWLNETHHGFTHIDIRQDRTHYILKQLSFEWPSISREALINYLKKALSYGEKS